MFSPPHKSYQMKYQICITTQLAKMSIDLKFVKLTAGVLEN